MKEVAALLEVRKVPFELVYGPEAKPPTTITRPRIVFERPARADSGAFNDSAGQLTRKLRFDVTIFAKSSKVGANNFDHERLADKLVDQIMPAVRQACTVRKQPCRPAGTWGKLSADELNLRELTTWPGCVYGIGFEVDRGLKDENWLDEGAATVAFADPNDPESEGVRFLSTTTVTLQGSGGPGETGCGG